MIEKKFEYVAKTVEESIDIISKMGIRILEMKDRQARIMLPMKPNVNHLGAVYAGSLFTLAEFSGGVIFAASFDYNRYITIAKEFNIRFRRIAATDMFLNVVLTQEQVDEYMHAADENGKSDYSMDLEILDESGEVCCVVRGTWQLRKLPS